MLSSSPQTQQDSRKTVCFFCLKKCDQQVTKFMKYRINKLFQQEVDFNDERISVRICNSCRSELQKRVNGQKEGEILNLFDFQTMRIKRRSIDCNCMICHVRKLAKNHVHLLSAPFSKT